ncbi:Bis(5'nucleosyl)-tetraphosphatase, ApaH [Sulfitobacter noctilucicola]|uniref:Serine/threonine protein phosphatase 1 n=1 Tax=Sulfitobacter noctilucicola TaxID=1342301 RepID=A0A7W6M4Y4_9RHOB|nr:metallophosphoesterase family protein [Sulfitobacter noctilucicola]KIN62974.1 Bis(5'nucleosyl)-tetraphosphatase, ApaH [Sulfitobacter noctilucicola]MBB4172499.1 serine/threonine protein phosphatase 1 [Sulfitobacter noctilucicola]
MTAPIYTIGDIHGQLAELHRVLDLIKADGGDDAKVVFLGDYTDRGPNSCGVLDLLIEGQAAGRNWTFLQGNHDRMFHWFMRDYPQHEAYLPVELYWLHPRLGGDTTLASYGIKFTEKSRQLDVHKMALKNVPDAHVQFLKDAVLSFETDELFFAHAGIRPGVALAAQDEEDLLWIRKEFHDDTRAHPKLIVHGHTPVDRATHYGNRINLDSGAGYGKPLTAAVFEGADCWVLGHEGRAPLLPE